MGAAANLASRPEGLNKFFGTQLIAPETVVETAGPEFLWRPIGRVMSKGVINPIPIYELVGLKESIKGLKNVHPQSEADITAVRLWQEAFDAYLARDWTNAKSLMSRYRRTNKLDLVAPFYLKRIADYVKPPPSQDWSGVEVFESK